MARGRSSNASDVGPDARAAGEGVAAVYLPLDALRPNPRNPRAHGSEVERLARTILRTTWGAPIIAQASTRRIIGGHGRLEAARLIAAGMVVDGIGRSDLIHPSRVRRCSTRELARLASFPDRFQFTDRKRAVERIGNSVPPLLMRSIASHVRTLIGR